MKRTCTYIRKTLNDYYSTNEIESFVYIIFEHVYGYTKHDFILNDSKVIPEHDFNKIKGIINQLVKNEPIQYILGNTEFYGLKFNVNENVLIPRQETEELVDLIIKSHKNETLKVLDIGTGSGCIPITLKKFNACFNVYSCDISVEAINVAKANAKQNNVDITIINFDILSDQSFDEGNFDIIVSNPPYVTNKEKKLMEANVLDYEPELALFVPDNDPLLFYRAIVEKTTQLLKPGGEIYFEINEDFGDEVLDLLKAHHFQRELIKDLNEKDRIVFGRKQ